MLEYSGHFTTAIIGVTTTTTVATTIQRQGRGWDGICFSLSKFELAHRDKPISRPLRAMRIVRKSRLRRGVAHVERATRCILLFYCN